MAYPKTDFQTFIDVNLLKKKDIAEYLGVSNAFITQLSRGDRDIPKDKMALIKANVLGWDVSMFDKNTPECNTTPQSSPLSHADTDKLLDLLAKKERSLAKAQEHIDRLIDLIEKMQK